MAHSELNQTFEMEIFRKNSQLTTKTKQTTQSR